jgi:hypothetical protein
LFALADTVLTAYNANEYDRKLAHEKNDVPIKDPCASPIGFPKVLTNVSSLSISIAMSHGPHENCPTYAPTEEDTAGIIPERSISRTRTPGLNKFKTPIFILLKS